MFGLPEDNSYQTSRRLPQPSPLQLSVPAGRHPGRTTSMRTGFFQRGPRPVRPHTRTFTSISERLVFLNVILRNLVTHIAPEPPTRTRTFHQAPQAQWLAARRRDDDDW